MTAPRPDFLDAPETAAILAALPGARAVGGAVRDSLAGKAVQDVDLGMLRKALKEKGAIFEYQRPLQQDSFDLLRKQLNPPGPGRMNREL